MKKKTQEINTVWILQRQAAHVPKFFTQILLRSGREFTMVKLTQLFTQAKANGKLQISFMVLKMFEIYH